MTELPRERVRRALTTARDRLLSEMRPEGFWEGELSSSALSTATAVSALSICGNERDRQAVDRGLSWLRTAVNADGGWGDTTDSPSNLSTTLLTIAAMRLAGTPGDDGTLAAAESYVRPIVGRGSISEALQAVYGKDRTFAVPILVNCALAGMLPWKDVPALPYALALLPRGFYSALRLHVVSYALPALIAIGITIARGGKPAGTGVRGLLDSKALCKLAGIQPEDGGFLEATPLTSFVAMGLGASHDPEHPVVTESLAFIRRSQRPNGSWPIDTNLSVWLTTGAISALSKACALDGETTQRVRTWLTQRQFSSVSEYTGAAPGGFSWTHLPGGVPDADDTSGAVLACLALGEREPASKAVEWLLGLQNRDGGWPAFCRGWGQLAFDRSSPDITAHAIRAIRALDPGLADARPRAAVDRGFAYLAATQRSDGSWLPLWFGNQSDREHGNPVFGASRSLLAYIGLDPIPIPVATGVRFLVDSQNDDGGWGGARGIASSMEETALAVTALASFPKAPGTSESLRRGAEYLVARVEDGSWTVQTPIGLYFSSLWYSERLYPVIWTLDALGALASMP